MHRRYQQTTNFISFDVTVPEAGEYEMRLVYSIATGFPDADFEVQVKRYALHETGVL